jgi:hypothetical protein
MPCDLAAEHALAAGRDVIWVQNCSLFVALAWRPACLFGDHQGLWSAVVALSSCADL